MANANNLTVDGELRYIVQWFAEWSELQRDDFLPILIECLCASNNGPAAINGILSGLANAGFAEKPMSLFQCRVKLFREWSAKWPESVRQSLQEKIQIIDAEYGERVRSELLGDHINNGVAAVNGFANISGIDGGESSELDDRVLSPSIPVQIEPVLA